jgi:hypothetical protein
MLQFKKGKIAAIRHVMIPSLAFTWRPDFSEEKWGYYKSVQIDSTGRQAKYSVFEQNIFGGPAGGKSSLLSYSIDNIVEMKVRQETDSATNFKKVKLLESLSLSGNFNMAADSLKWSLIGISGRTILFNKLNLLFSSTFDPYVTVFENNREIRTNTTQLAQNNRLARFATANFALNYSLINRSKTPATKKSQSDERNELEKHRDDYYDFNIPFNLNIGYNYYYINNVGTADYTTQTFNFNGDLQVTPNWKFTFNSGYDFQQKDLSYTSIGIIRNLHCWEMRVNWIPTGVQQSYYFQINVKSSLLQDLKLSRKNDRFDRR